MYRIVTMLFFVFACVMFTSSCKSDQKPSVSESAEPDLSEFKKEKVISTEELETKLKEESEVAGEQEVAEAVVETPKEEAKPAPAPKKPKKRKKKKAVKYAKVKFEQLVYDFGEITEGDIVTHKFKFTNDGNAPLEFLTADPSCGCAQPTIPFLATAPGDEGQIVMTFNSVSKEGLQEPEVVLETNSKVKHITIKMVGTVKPKVKEQKKEEKKPAASIKGMPKDSTIKISFDKKDTVKVKN